MGKKITMEDIASELNVSKSLVSRALGNKYGVGDEMRSKIQMTAIKKGYNFVKEKRASSKKIESITVVLEKHDIEDMGYWNKIIHSIEKTLNERGISIFLSVVENHQEEIIPLSIRQMKSDGVILLGLLSEKLIYSVIETGLPIVMMDTNYLNLKYDHVMANNYMGTFEATELLIEKGHKNIGFVGSLEYSYSFQERYRGVAECVMKHKEKKLKLYSITERYDDFYVPFSANQFKNKMKAGDRPTAVICGNDITAFCVYDLARETGIKIPDDLSVVGFDDVAKAEWVHPKLTTINISKTMMGERAVSLLIKQFKNPGKSHEQLLIGTRIVQRESVKDLNISEA